MFSHSQLQKIMGKAYVNAAKSPCPSSQNGAVIITRRADGELELIANGHNHYYEGIPAADESDRDTRLKRIEHAERDAIYQAVYRGVALKGSIMVCPWVACADCARAIIGSGIAAVVHHRQRYELTPETWVAELDQSLHWMQDSGIYLFEYDGAVPGVKPIRVGGRSWSPASLTFIGE
jgi:dCMP deaminase